MKKIILRLFILTTLSLFFSSCLKEVVLPEKAENLETRVGFPFIYSSLRIDDLVNKINTNEFSLKTNQERYYSFYFNPPIAYFPKFEELIKIPSQDISLSNLSSIQVLPGLNEIPALTSLPGLSFNIAQSGSSAPNNQDDYLLNSDTKTIIFKGGTMTMEMAHSGTELANIEVYIDNLTDVNNNPLKFTFKINKNSSQSANSQTATLAGYSLKLDGANQFHIRTSKLTFTDPNSVNGSTPKQTTETSNLTFVKFRMDNPLWKKIVTKLGKFELPIVKNAKIDLHTISLEPFKNNESDNPRVEFDFVNPIVKVTFFNSTGIRSDLKMAPVYAISKLNNRIDTILSPTFTLPRSINGEYTSFPTTISPNLLKKLFQRGPKSIEYGLMWIVNENSKTSDSDFILDTSRFATKVEIELPLYGNVKLFDLRSKVPYAFNQSNQTVDDSKRYLNDAIFKLDFRNQMPIDFIVQFDFVDENGKVVDSLFTTQKQKATSGFIVAAPVDANGVSIGESKPPKPVEVFISKERLANLDTKAKFVIIKAAMNTKDYDLRRPNVKIFPEDSLIVQMSLNANINFTFETDNKK